MERPQTKESAIPFVIGDAPGKLGRLTILFLISFDQIALNIKGTSIDRLKLLFGRIELVLVEAIKVFVIAKPIERFEHGLHLLSAEVMLLGAFEEVPQNFVKDEFHRIFWHIIRHVLLLEALAFREPALSSVF